MAKGKKTGGRQKGTPNKLTAETREAALQAGESPLAYMLRVMRDGTEDPERRDRMAVSAAPYLHPRLASVEQRGEVTHRYVVEAPSDQPLTAEEWRELYGPPSQATH